MADLPRNYDQFARDIFADFRHICKNDSPKVFMNALIQETRTEIATKIGDDPELGILDKKLEAIQNRFVEINESDSQKYEAALKKLKVLFQEEYGTLWKDLSPRLQKKGLTYNYDNIKEVIIGSEFYRVVKKASDNGILDIKPIDMMIDLVVTKNLATMRATPSLEQVAKANTSDLSDKVKAQVDRAIREAKEPVSSTVKPSELQTREKELELA